MRVLMVSDFYPGIHPRGGMGTHVQAVCLELAKRGHKVVVCTPKLSDSESTFELDGPVEVRRIWGLFQRLPFLYKRANIDARYHPPVQDWLVTRELRKTVESLRPDVIHAQGMITYSVLPMIKQSGVPLVFTLHDYGVICPALRAESCEGRSGMRCLYCIRKNHGMLKALMVYVAAIINWPKVRQIRWFIAISPYQRELVRRTFGLADEAIVLIANPIDLQVFSPTACEKASWSGSEGGLEMVSSMQKIMHVCDLRFDKIAAVSNFMYSAPYILAECPNTQLLVVGTGEFLDCVRRIADEINRHLDCQAIVIMGELRGKEMPRNMRSADIVVGVGRVALEGMACGKPVIVAGSVTGPFGGNYGGIVTPDNVMQLRAHNFTGRNTREKATPTKIARDCIRLLRDGQLKSYLGDFGRRYVQEECDVKRIADKIEATYERAVQEAGVEKISVGSRSSRND